MDPGVPPSLHVLALKGHDPQSGLLASGIDTMAYGQVADANATGSAYYYQGTRRFASGIDSFHRQGLGISLLFGKGQADLLLQRGSDSAGMLMGGAATSSGGFAQLRWGFSPALRVLARYDAAYDPFGGLQESLTTTLVVRARRNSKLTLEDVSLSGRHILNAAFLFAY